MEMMGELCQCIMEANDVTMLRRRIHCKKMSLRSSSLRARKHYLRARRKPEHRDLEAEYQNLQGKSKAIRSSKGISSVIFVFFLPSQDVKETSTETTDADTGRRRKSTPTH